MADIYGQLVKAQLENLTSDISSPAEGMIYFRTDTNVVRVYDGAAWGTLVTNPMTGAGDMIYGGASGVVTRLADPASASQWLLSGNASAPTWSNTTTAVKVIQNGNTGLTLGADNNASTLTNATTKVARLAFPHYTNAEEPVTGLLAITGTSDNTVSIGGGTSAHNAATVLEFYTAANNTTTSGTLRASVTSTGVTKFITPTAATLNYDNSGTTPFMQMCSTSATGVPTILGNNNTASATTGLALFAGTKDDNTGGDMRFDARENDNSAYGTTTRTAFMWSVNGSEIANMTRAGSTTLGPAAAGVTHRINSNTTATGTAVLTMGNAPGSGTRAAVGYLTMNINGTDYVIPYFATS